MMLLDNKKTHKISHHYLVLNVSWMKIFCERKNGRFEIKEMEKEARVNINLKDGALYGTLKGWKLDK